MKAIQVGSSKHIVFNGRWYYLDYRDDKLFSITTQIKSFRKGYFVVDGYMREIKIQSKLGLKLQEIAKGE